MKRVSCGIAGAVVLALAVFLSQGDAYRTGLKHGAVAHAANVANAAAGAPAGAAATPVPVGEGVGAWEETINSDGLVISKRAVTGSRYFEVLGETTLRTPMNTLLALFLEPASYKDWVFGCKEGRKLDNLSPVDFLFYTRVMIPWPFDDRDLAATASFRTDPVDRSVTATLTEKGGVHPEQPGAVRVTRLRGFWKLTPLPADGTVRLSIQLHVEPGGNLTSVFVNLTLSRILQWTMKRLHRLADEPRHAVTLPVIPLRN